MPVELCDAPNSELTMLPHCMLADQVLELAVQLAASWKLDLWPLALDRVQHALSYQYSSNSSSSSSMSAAAAQCERAEAAIRTQISSDSSATVWSLLLERPTELQQALLQLYAAAPGCDLPRLDLLLRLMLECCTASAATAATAAAAVDLPEATAAKVSVRTEKRLQMLAGLSRRLLKAAPPVLDFKHLTGGSDPLAPSTTAAAAAEAALCALRGCLTAATAAAVAKLAPRLGITASAAYASCAVRVLCGADAELPPESVALLRQQQQQQQQQQSLPLSSSNNSVSGSEGEAERRAASATVLQFLQPLLLRMATTELVAVARCAVAPAAVEARDAGLSVPNGGHLVPLRLALPYRCVSTVMMLVRIHKGTHRGNNLFSSFACIVFTYICILAQKLLVAAHAVVQAISLD
jgi:hypothetical protein